MLRLGARAEADGLRVRGGGAVQAEAERGGQEELQLGEGEGRAPVHGGVGEGGGDGGGGEEGGVRGDEVVVAGASEVGGGHCWGGGGGVEVVCTVLVERRRIDVARG